MANGVEEQGVMRSKGFWVAKGVKEQGVLRSKLWLCQVFWAAKCVKLLRSKVFLSSKVFFEPKCASASVPFLKSRPAWKFLVAIKSLFILFKREDKCFFTLMTQMPSMVFSYQNCSDLLWEKIVLVIEKNFWNSRLKAANFLKNLVYWIEQWKVIWRKLKYPLRFCHL